MLAIILADPSTILRELMEPGTYAHFDTTEGSFVIRLFDKEAPNTVANFVGLAEGTKEWRDPATGAAAVEQWTFAGEVAAKGVRWPRRVNVSRDGVPVVDLDIFEFGIATAADLERDARPK